MRLGGHAQQAATFHQNISHETQRVTERQRSVGGMASGIPKVVTRYALLNATMPCKGKIIGGICSVLRTHQKPDERSGNRRHCKVDEGAHIQDDQINNVGPKKRNAFALRLHSACIALAAPPPP